MRIVNSNSDWKPIIHASFIILFFSTLYIIFFSPVIFSNKLLAPGDGFIYYLPAFYSARTLWTDLILSGFPSAADPQIQTWYPISFLFSLIPNSWNAFILSAYVLASCFCYGYVYTITSSRLAGVVSGIVYGMSGFMMAHLGHVTIIHAAAWMPLSIWALEKLRQSCSTVWLAIASFSFAASILAGHPQITVYSIVISAAYSLFTGWTLPIGRWKYYKLAFIALVIGVALSAIQILPTAEISALGPRSRMSFPEFNSYSLPPVEAIQLLFPYFFGGYLNLGGFSSPPYFGTWGLTETTGYVGLFPLLLAVVALLTSKFTGKARFWAIVALVTFLLTLGRATPLAGIVHQIPILNKFRAPGRHFIEMTLAISILAGMGVADIRRQLIRSSLLIKILLGGIGAMLFALLGAVLFSNGILERIQEVASAEAAAKFTLLPWLNLAIGLPLIVLLLITILLIYWIKAPRSKFISLLLPIVLIFDMGSFGWFYEWQSLAPSTAILTPTSSAQRYKELLEKEQQRILPVGGGVGTTFDVIPPNISKLWGVPSASGYGPLMLSRFGELLSMGTTGTVSGAWANPDNRALDVMAVRYVFAPTGSPSGPGNSNWQAGDLAISLGSGCGAQQSGTTEFVLPPASVSQINEVAIVSSLACSVNVQNGEAVLQVLLTAKDGKVSKQVMRAGIDTSESAYECSDVRPVIRHQQATVFESSTVQREGLSQCQVHNYVSSLPIKNLGDVQSLKLEWVGKSGAINVQKINLVNTQTQQSYPIDKNLTFLTNTTHWQPVEIINQTGVYENLGAMPRAWLVPEVVHLEAKDVLSAIQSSKLPDGQLFDPARIALIEEHLDFEVQDSALEKVPEIVKLNDAHIQVQTNSPSPAFLVLSDVYYPGWKASVDGKPARIFQTDYVLRGVPLPAGKHTVSFKFEPLSFRIGVGISAAALLLLAYLIAKSSETPLTKLLPPKPLRN